MKCKVLLLSHDELAGAFISAVEFVYGDTSGFGYINMPDPFDQMAYIKSIEDVVEENSETGVLILADLFGGSPFLTSARILKNNFDKVELVTGYNLAMLLEIAPMIENSTIAELKEAALNAGRGGMVDIKERMK